MEKRAGDVATAMDSVVFYQRWLDEQDGTHWQTSKILGDIRAYNIGMVEASAVREFHAARAVKKCNMG